jgi:hypothetical protein
MAQKREIIAVSSLHSGGTCVPTTCKDGIERVTVTGLPLEPRQTRSTSDSIKQSESVRGKLFPITLGARTLSERVFGGTTEHIYGTSPKSDDSSAASTRSCPIQNTGPVSHRLAKEDGRQYVYSGTARSPILDFNEGGANKAHKPNSSSNSQRIAASGYDSHIVQVRMCPLVRVSLPDHGRIE